MGERILVLDGDTEEVCPCYRNLLIAVEYHAGRWTDAAVAAAAAVVDAERLTADEWAALLDRIEAAIRATIPEYLPSAPRIRARYLGN
jgi:hypothetical protein